MVALTSQAAVLTGGSPIIPCFATLPAICKMWPSTGSFFSVELLSWVRPSLCFGMTRKCTGACGLMSLQWHMATVSSTADLLLHWQSTPLT